VSGLHDGESQVVKWSLQQGEPWIVLMDVSIGVGAMRPILLVGVRAERAVYVVGFDQHTFIA